MTVMANGETCTVSGETYTCRVLAWTGDKVDVAAENKGGETLTQSVTIPEKFDLMKKQLATAKFVFGENDVISFTEDDVNCVEGVCSLSAVTRQVNIPAEVIGYAPEVYLDGKKADVDTSLFVGKDEQCLEVATMTLGGVGEVPPPPPAPPVAPAPPSANPSTGGGNLPGGFIPTFPTGPIGGVVETPSTPILSLPPVAGTNTPAKPTPPVAGLHTTPAAPEVNAAPVAPQSPAAPVAVAKPTAPREALARTGVESGALAPVALAVFAGGLALLVLARRREEKARGKHVA
ncbi:MAG: hypothetical protein SPK50_01875 [Mobiluncus porci]|uniref:hypothetical protein n=1 Tax=Mobiluncus porci TaxID=2652278 RepID=UPI0023F157E1|nr:hypothetical protein [Mobiluncus porci]MDD7541385.1 hypothetical protein [Mobiluncus porci]MDY5747868.1 hypothetical protein [Mobiluncus porci]